MNVASLCKMKNKTALTRAWKTEMSLTAPDVSEVIKSENDGRLGSDDGRPSKEG